MSFSGLFASMPIYSFFFISISLANIGFPGTSGFLPELEILISILQTSTSVLFGALLGMFITTIGTLIVILRLLFGHVKIIHVQSNWLDITYLEFFILSNLLGWIIILGFYDILNIPWNGEFISDTLVAPAHNSIGSVTSESNFTNSFELSQNNKGRANKF
jgi:NADH:ubiquinone oxidoreductase subunit 4 (subunit M)